MHIHLRIQKHIFTINFHPVPFFCALLLSHSKCHCSSSVSLFTWQMLPLLPKKATHDATAHKHTHAKAIRQHERMYGKKMEKWKEPKTHRLYAINVNKIKLNLFVCWVHFTVCLFVLVKQKQSDKCKRTCVCVFMFVYELMPCLKCILDVTTQYYIKCLPCPPSKPPPSSPFKHRSKKDRTTKHKKVADKLRKKHREMQRAKKRRRQKSRKSFRMACEVDIAENVNKFN